MRGSENVSSGLSLLICRWHIYFTLNYMYMPMVSRYPWFFMSKIHMYLVIFKICSIKLICNLVTYINSKAISKAVVYMAQAISTLSIFCFLIGGYIWNRGFVLEGSVIFVSNPQSQVSVFLFITWYKVGPAWTHALEGPHCFLFTIQRNKKNIF